MHCTFCWEYFTHNSLSSCSDLDKYLYRLAVWEAFVDSFFFLNHILSYILDLSPSLKKYQKYILTYWNLFIVTLYLVDSL